MLFAVSVPKMAPTFATSRGETEHRVVVTKLTKSPMVDVGGNCYCSLKMSALVLINKEEWGRSVRGLDLVHKEWAKRG